MGLESAQLNRIAPKRIRAFAAVFSAGIGLIFAFPVFAQLQIQVQVQGGPEGVATPVRWGLEPPNDQDAVSWLKRASEAASSGDWKLAADTLERVVEQHGDRTVSLDNTHFYSAMQLAYEQIAGWPEDGLVAYRQLYDADARRLLDFAKAQYDFDALRTVSRKYSMTTYGPEAMNLLATWLLDRRQCRESLELLARLEKLPHNNVPVWEILSKRIAAYAYSGQSEKADAALKAARSLPEDRKAALPEDWSIWTDQFQQYLNEAKQSGHSNIDLSSDVWRYRLGATEWGGRLSAIDPVITQDDGWTTAMPGSERLNLDLIAHLIKKRGRPPIWQAVSDGEKLFITCPAGLMARDLSTFDLAWQAFPKGRSRNPQIQEHRTRVNFGGQIVYYDGEEEPVPRLDFETTQSLFHEYRGELSTAMGLVFVIDQEPLGEEQFPTMEGVVPPNSHISDDTLTQANTLRAFEADTGRAKWFRGRGGPPSDELRLAHFCSAPVVAGSRLIVPYRQGNDLLLAILDREGEYVRSVLLGTGRVGLFPMHGVLPPTVHDGTIYVQTGAGLFFALDEHDYSLRWMTRYEPHERSDDHRVRGRNIWIDDHIGVPQPDQWLSSPVLVAGGVVILAAQDADKLYAFDIETGVEAWHANRKGHRYLVGADAERVIVAGNKVSAISIFDGETIWATSGLVPTGRPVICGEHVLVPTATGLARLALGTGEQEGDSLPAPGGLGNLFAMDGALYSVAADHVSKFPDPKQTRLLAMARLEKNPSDLDALLRMSWLEEQAEAWASAESYLDRAEATLAEFAPMGTSPNLPEIQRQRDDYASRISHQRVTILLSRASSAEDAVRGELLMRAVNAARRESDRLNTGLAYCEFLEDTDRFADGFARALDMLRDMGGEPMRVDNNLRIRADVLIAERLRQMWSDMSVDEHDEAESRIEEAVASAREANGRGKLMRLADALGFTPLGRRLDIEIGVSAIESGENETGIYFLERARLRSATDGERLEPLLRLILAYRFPGERLPADPAAAIRLLDELDESSSGEMVPSPIGRQLGLASCAKVSDFVASIRSTMPRESVGDDRLLPRILRDSKRLALQRELIGPDGQRGSTHDGASFWDRSRPHDFLDEVLPIQLSGEIRGLDLRPQKSNDDSWLSIQRSVLEDASNSSDRRESNAFDAAIWGRVAVLATPDQVCAVGLASGRSMWPPLTVDANAGPLPDPSVVCGGGIVVVAADSQSLVAARARDDAAPLWRRTWARNALGLLRIVDDTVVAVDQEATRVFVLDLSNGRLRGEYALVNSAPNLTVEQIDRSDNDAHAAIVDRIVVRSHGTRVIGLDVRTGKPAWNTIEFKGIVKGLYALSGGCFGVAHGPNKFSLIRAESGEPVCKTLSADGLAMPPIDVVLDRKPGSAGIDDGQLLFFTRTDESPTELVLESFPLDGVTPSWRKRLGQLATISRQMMRASSEFVAVVQNGVPPGRDRPRNRMRIPQIDNQLPPNLLILNKRTGKLCKPRVYEFGEGALGNETGPDLMPVHASRRIMDVVVLNDRIVCVAPEGFFVLADEAAIGAKGLVREGGE